MDPRELLSGHLRSATCGWSIGAYGAIAEFHRDAPEPAEIDGLRVVTARGAIALDPPPGCRAFGDERVIVLAAPEARMSARTGVACVGADRDALRARDRGALLFDLGLGLANCEFCVRTDDAALLERLKRASPHRVVRSRAGRIEVFQDIAPEGGTSPEGPHTHLLPRLLRRGRTHRADVPLPEGWLPCVSLYPLKSVHEVL